MVGLLLSPLTIVMDSDSAPLDLILLPGVAFDTECNRVSRSYWNARKELITSWEGGRRIMTGF